MPEPTPPQTTNQRREINLDAARAERAAKRGEPPVLVLNGETHELPHELPGDFIEAIVEERLRDAFVVILGEETALEVQNSAEGPMSVDDWEFLAQGIVEVYGLQGGLGNLRPSGS